MTRRKIRDWLDDHFEIILGLSRVVFVYGCLFYGIYQITTAHAPPWMEHIIWGAWLIGLSFLASSDKK